MLVDGEFHEEPLLLPLLSRCSLVHQGLRNIEQRLMTCDEAGIAKQHMCIYTSSWYHPSTAYNCKRTRSLMSYGKSKYHLHDTFPPQECITRSAQGSSSIV